MDGKKEERKEGSRKNDVALAEIRKAVKSRKPKYRRQDSHKKSRLGRGRKKLIKWRKPKGTDSKVRLRIKGHLSMPEVGYGSPRKIKGLIYHDGRLLKPIRVDNLSQLNDENRKDNIFILGSVGLKKKLQIVKKAKELGIELLNVDTDKFLEQTESILQDRKNKRKAYKEHRRKKEEKKKEEKKKAKEEELKKKESEKTKEKEKKEVMKQAEKTGAIAKEKISKKVKKVEIHRQALEK